MDDLRDKIAEAILETVPLHQGGYKTADAALSVVGPELERRELAVETLIDQRESLRHRAEQAEAKLENAFKLLDKYRETTSVILGQRDALKATIERVRDAHRTDARHVHVYGCPVCTALATPTPTEETP